MSIPRPKLASRALTRATAAIATGLGAGYSPVAPGTAGSALGLLLFLPLMRGSIGLQIACSAALFFVAVASATAVSRRTGRKDPRIVVVDEILGMWTTLIGHTPTFSSLVVAFVAFRVMDVIKPFPARQLERAREGWGIVLDDLMAGLYASLVLLVVRRWLSAS